MRYCRGRQTANTLESNRRCEKAETECEDTLEREQLVKLPSTGRFEDRFSHCQAAFDRACIGPAHNGQVRLHNAHLYLRSSCTMFIYLGVWTFASTLHVHTCLYMPAIVHASLQDVLAMAFHAGEQHCHHHCPSLEILCSSSSSFSSSTMSLRAANAQHDAE